MDTKPHWNELFHRLSREITVIPVTSSNGPGPFESSYFNHFMNQSRLVPKNESYKVSDSTGASVMSLPLVFPLDPPNGFNSIPKRQTIEVDYPPTPSGSASQQCSSELTVQNLNSSFQEVHQKIMVKNEQKNAPRANVLVNENGETIFSCTRCDAAFNSALVFQEHWQLHLHERPYVCNECGKALKRKEHLDRHRTAHSSERPHQCHLCDKRFKRSEHLTRHAITHAEIKPFICQLCHKGFNRKEHLNKHFVTHCSDQKNNFNQGNTWGNMLDIKFEISEDQKYQAGDSGVLQEF
ncbi:zinc finger protein 708-like [Artemia franciscana]|uniref:C2H2-type domain-containing protein n=1 Tax=Artemia franciscana TaxID=6661 RepID=A0AA88KYN2_ARTSF|nr:hypothetical protein QYM36_014690 [Artemia franciscana]KAK2706737.1 hypothetical protein QYM36_014690 [Artemia franciscana]